MNTIYFNNTLTQWVTTLLLILLSISLSVLLYRKLGTWLGKMAKKTGSNGVHVLVNSLRLPIITTLILFGSYFSVKLLNIPDPINSIFARLSAFLAVVLIIWIAVKFFNVLQNELITPFIEKTGSNLDKKLLIFLCSFVKIALLVLGISYGFDNAGYSTVKSVISTEIYGNSIVRWASVLFLIVLTVFLCRLLIRELNRINLSQKLYADFTDFHIKKVRYILALILGTYGIAFSIGLLDFTDNLTSKIDNIFGFLITVLVTWLLVRVYDAIHYDIFVPKADKADKAFETHGIFNHQLLPIIKLGVTIVVWVLGIIIAMSNAGYDVGAVLAGLGIGGLAFALAAQDLVANMYGGVTILIQRPFKIGDHIKVEGIDGWIKEIGLRATKIADFYGQQLTVPNRKFTDEIVTNIDARTRYFELRKLNLHTDTTVEQIESALIILDEIAKDCELTENVTWVAFDKVGDYSYELEYWYAIQLWSAKEKDRFPGYFHKVSAAKTYVNLEIIRRFKANDIKLTFPVHSVNFNPTIQQEKSLFASSETDIIHPLFEKEHKMTQTIRRHKGS